MTDRLPSIVEQLDASLACADAKAKPDMTTEQDEESGDLHEFLDEVNTPQTQQETGGDDE